MQKLFMKKTIVDYNSLLDMKEDFDQHIINAEIYAKAKLDKNIRSTKINAAIKPIDYPDVTTQLLQLVPAWNSKRLSSDYLVYEFNYLIYNKGDHFKKHRDRLNKPPDRIYSTSTLISQSSDFEGGELIIYDNDNEPINTDLQVGETAFFDSWTSHQVNPVTKGTREVLVAWIYKKSDLQNHKKIL